MAAVSYIETGPMAHSVLLWFETQRYDTWVEYRLVGVVHKQCSKLFKGIECASLGSISERVGHSADFGLPSDVIVLKAA